jgi:hypothetical protein
MAYVQTQTWKVSKPERVGDSWRIRRHDGELVLWFATRDLAQRAIDTSPWLQ